MRIPQLVDEQQWKLSHLVFSNTREMDLILQGVNPTWIYALRKELARERGYHVRAAILREHHAVKRKCHFRARWSLYYPAWWSFVSPRCNPHQILAKNVVDIVTSSAPDWLLIEPSDGFSVFTMHCELSRDKEALSWLANTFFKQVEPRLFSLRKTFSKLIADSQSPNKDSSQLVATPCSSAASGISLINSTDGKSYVGRITARIFRIRPNDIAIYHPQLAQKMQLLALEVRRSVLTHDLQLTPSLDNRDAIEKELGVIQKEIEKRSHISYFTSPSLKESKNKNHFNSCN